MWFQYLLFIVLLKHKTCYISPWEKQCGRVSPPCLSWMVGHTRYAFFCLWVFRPLRLHPACVNAFVVYDELSKEFWVKDHDKDKEKKTQESLNGLYRCYHLWVILLFLCPCLLICFPFTHCDEYLWEYIKAHLHTFFFFSPRQSNISQRLGIIMPMIMRAASEANETNPFNKLFFSVLQSMCRLYNLLGIIKQISHLFFSPLILDGADAGDGRGRLRNGNRGM